MCACHLYISFVMESPPIDWDKVDRARKTAWLLEDGMVKAVQRVSFQGLNFFEAAAAMGPRDMRPQYTRPRNGQEWLYMTPMERARYVRDYVYKDWAVKEGSHRGMIVFRTCRSNCCGMYGEMQCEVCQHLVETMCKGDEMPRAWPDNYGLVSVGKEHFTGWKCKI